MSKKLISTPLDNDKRLDDCVRRIINISQRELIRLEKKAEEGELDPSDINKLTSIAKTVREQQKHRIDIEKLQSTDETHNHLHVTQEQLDKLLEAKKCKN